jgi:hypothetical protein
MVSISLRDFAAVLTLILGASNQKGEGSRKFVAATGLQLQFLFFFLIRLLLLNGSFFLVWDAGRDSPDMWTSGDSYRYGHEYQLLQGELLVY